MTALLILLAASATQPPAARIQALATARVVAGSRIRLDSNAPVPAASRRIVIRREAGRPMPAEFRLVEFQ